MMGGRTVGDPSGVFGAVLGNVAIYALPTSAQRYCVITCARGYTASLGVCP